MSLGKKFIRYVGPSVASMWIFSLYTMVDGIFVAHGVGPEALVAVNLSAPFTALVFAIGLTFATGVSTVISRTLGEGDETKAKGYFNQNIWVLIAVSAVISALVLFNLDSVARFLGATGTTLAYTKEYVGVIAGFAVFFILSYNFEVLVKVEGAPHLSVVGVTCCALMNVVLDYVFVMQFGWGVRGAAIATGVSQVTSTLIFAAYLFFWGKKLRFGKFRWDLAIYKRVVPVGMAEGVTELSNGIVIFLFNQTILSVIGQLGIVSYTVISYVNTLVLMTMSGISQGIQPLVSFYRGMGNRGYIHRLLKYALIAVGCSAAVAIGVAQLGTNGIVGLFLDPSDAAMFEYTASALRMFSISFLMLGFNVVMSGFFAAIERPAFSLSISLGRGFVLLTLSLMVMAKLFGATGIWISPAVSETLCLVLTGALAIRYAKILRKERAKDLAIGPENFPEVESGYDSTI